MSIEANTFLARCSLFRRRSQYHRIPTEFPRTRTWIRLFSAL